MEWNGRVDVAGEGLSFLIEGCMASAWGDLKMLRAGMPASKRFQNSVEFLTWRQDDWIV